MNWTEHEVAWLWRTFFKGGGNALKEHSLYFVSIISISKVFNAIKWYLNSWYWCCLRTCICMINYKAAPFSHCFSDIVAAVVGPSALSIRHCITLSVSKFLVLLATCCHNTSKVRVVLTNTRKKKNCLNFYIFKCGTLLWVYRSVMDFVSKTCCKCQNVFWYYALLILLRFSYAAYLLGDVNESIIRLA